MVPVPQIPLPRGCCHLASWGASGLLALWGQVFPCLPPYSEEMQFRFGD